MRPKSIYLAVLFFLSPFLLYFIRNLFGLPTGPGTLGWTEWLTLLCYWSPAVLVLLRMKFAWLASGILVSVPVLINGLTLITHFNDLSAGIYIVQFIFSLVIMSSLLIVMKYLDTKFFDRRDNFSILGAAIRYDINVPFQLKHESFGSIQAHTLSLSRTGMLAKLDSIPESLYLREWKMSLPAFKLQNIVCQFVEINKDGRVRIQFADVNPLVAWNLQKTLKTYK